MRLKDKSALAILPALALLACGDATSHASSEPSQEQTGGPEEAQGATSSDAPPPQDLATAARGATLVSASYDERGALALIDGDAASNWNVGTVRNPGPYIFVVELMAPAALSAVGIDGSGERPGGVVGGSAGRVRIEGSAEAADSGFRDLASIEASPEGQTLAELEGSEKVRWLRFTVEGPASSDAAFIYLDELVAYGSLDEVDDGDRFTGVFQTGRADFVKLEQDGSLISGCYVENGGRSAGTIDGSLVEGVALVNWRSDQGIVGTALFTRNAAGELGGLRYRQRSRTSWGGPQAEDEGQVRCEDDSVANPVAQALEDEGFARLYGIQFGYDSDVPLPSARPALDQLFEALSADQSLIVVIEGHTDADGSDTYNDDLSQRRAESIVAHLVGRGIDSGRVTALGKGESEPVASNDTADGKALNRRVEVRKAD